VSETIANIALASPPGSYEWGVCLKHIGKPEF